MGTVFKNRNTVTNKYSKVLADLDVCAIGLDFCDFLYYADFGMASEIGQLKDGELDIENWFSNITYFKFLMGINKKIFLIQDFQNEFLHDSLYNIERYITISQNYYKTQNGDPIKDVFLTWKDNDITLEEFRKEYFEQK